MAASIKPLVPNISRFLVISMLDHESWTQFHCIVKIFGDLRIYTLQGFVFYPCCVMVLFLVREKRPASNSQSVGHDSLVGNNMTSQIKRIEMKT